MSQGRLTGFREVKRSNSAKPALFKQPPAKKARQDEAGGVLETPAPHLVHSSSSEVPALDPAITDHDMSEEERLLRAFDLAGKYGPCVGLTRLERWERAAKFGLDPPVAIKQLLQEYEPKHPKHQPLWAHRV